MRFNSFLFAAAIAAMSMSLAGCAKDENPAGGNNGASTEPVDGAYMTVSLSDAPMTRASNFDEGEGEESFVRTMDVYFFDDRNILLGSSNATISAEKPGDMENGIEKEIDTYVPASVVGYLRQDETKEAYIVVVLNKHGISLPGDGLDEDALKAEQIEYAVFNAALTDMNAENVTSDKGFMMVSTNYFKDGVQTAMTPITKENVGIKSNTVSVAAEPVTVAVERVASKVTVKVKEGSDLNVIAWGLNVTNRKFFPVKTFTDAFVNSDGSVIAKYTDWNMKDDWNEPSTKRTHWAVDPNYTEGKVQDASNEHFKLLNLETDETAAAGEPMYCLENTFNEEFQMMNSTTTAIIIAQFVPKELAESGDKTWVNWGQHNNTVEDFVNLVVEDAKDVVLTYWYKTADNNYKQLESTDFEISYGDSKEIKVGDVVIGHTGSATVVLKEQIEGAADANLYVRSGQDEFTPAADARTDIKAALDKAVAEGGKVSVYYNGYNYYEVPIRHFNDAEVDWSADGQEEPNQPQHLGRYGLVRNNSYNVTVNSISNPGKPIEGGEIVPEGKPDDKFDYQLNVTIEVLAWTVRNQGVDL